MPDNEKLITLDNLGAFKDNIEEEIDSKLATKVDKVTGKSLSTNDFTDAEKTKLAGIESGAQVNAVTSVAGKTGAVTLSKSDVGLNNVDNTSDANKPISVATQGALDLKADKVTTYTKLETDALLAPKANSADVYAKGEADALLATKQNVLTFDPQPTANSTNPVTSGGVKGAIDSAISSVYRYKGSVETYAQLPISGMSVGDVYNVEEADPTHAVSAGDNVAWNGMTWDVLAGTIDLCNYYTIAQVDARLADKADKATTYLKTEVDSALAAKQATLISGTNIKTINSNPILGGGDLELYTVATDAEIMALFVSVENNTIIASGSVSENVMSGSGWSVSNNTLNM